MDSLKNSQALARLVSLWLKFSFAIVLITAGTLAFPGVASAACVCSPNDVAGDGLFTLQTQTIDGTMTDWNTVIADPDNNVCDGPRAMPLLVDLDAPVQSTGRDIVHFANTWDATWLYLFTERVGSSNNTQNFVYYADVDSDGLMEQGEPVIGVTWKGNNRNVQVYIGTYNEVTPGGDSMVDGGGMADGYAIPGDPGGFPGTANYSGTFGSANGLQMEFAVRWTDLGLPGITNITFHVSATNKALGTTNFAANIDDNLGGCGGGPGSTQFAALTFVPDVALSGNQGATVAAAHSLTNDGSGDDTFTFSSVVSGAHTPTVTFYIDDGDAVFEPGGDDGSPVTDSGVMATMATIDIWAAYAIAPQNPVDPADPLGTATITVTATSVFNNVVSEDVVDTVDVLVVPSIIVVKSASVVSDPLGQLAPNANAVPNAIVDYTIMITNEGPGAADIDSVDIIDAIPANMELFTGDLGGVIPGPVDRVAGATDCVITFNWVSANDMGDDVEFSSDGGTFYTAMVNGGFDSSITHLAVRTTGTLPGATAAGDPSCTFRIRMRIQ